MDLRASKFDFHLKLKDCLELPCYKGSVFRGGFGIAFKKVVCIQKQKSCSECLIKATCPYAYIFETEAGIENHMIPKNKKAPHPFVIEPTDDKKTRYQKEESIYFSIVLIGRAIEYLPYFIYSIDRLGEMGLGRDRVQFYLTSVYNINIEKKEKIYDGSTQTITKSYQTISLYEKFNINANQINLNLITPTRIRYQNKLTNELPFTVFIRVLLRRIHLLDIAHGTGKGINNHKELIKSSNEIKIKQSQIKWQDWTRYSTRQSATMKMGGIVGNILYEGDLTKFLTYLRFGELIHIGKGTSFGLGKYKLTINEKT